MKYFFSSFPADNVIRFMNLNACDLLETGFFHNVSTPRKYFSGHFFSLQNDPTPNGILTIFIWKSFSKGILGLRRLLGLRFSSLWTEKSELPQIYKNFLEDCLRLINLVLLRWNSLRLTFLQFSVFYLKKGWEMVRSLLQTFNQSSHFILFHEKWKESTS